MKRALSLLTVVLITTFLHAQNKPGTINGALSDSTGKPVEAATVQLLKASDQSLVKTVISDKAGNFSFEKIAEGKYLVSVSAAGFTKKQTASISVSATNSSVSLPSIRLSSQAKNLSGVTVTASRPYIEAKSDKMVVNVDASPSNAGATAMEVLEKSPGVSVDNDGNISLKGKQGVIIMMDGKPTYLSGADLANILKNMPAAAIDQIEIMTNPSSK